MLVKIGTADRVVDIALLTLPQAASGVAYAGECVFYGLVIRTDGTNAVGLNLFDSITAAGRRLLPSNVVIPGTANLWSISFTPPILCARGVYVQITAAGGGTFGWQIQYGVE